MTDFKTLENKDNYLLNRKEIKIVIQADKNPSFNEALLIFNKEFKADPEATVIKNVKGKFGRDTFLLTAFVYKTKEDKEKFEPKAKVKKAAPGA